MSEERFANLLDLWNRQWSPCPPFAHQLRGFHRERWVRFHSLPGSKRYPTDESEMAIVLERHYRLLAELFEGHEVLVMTCRWSESSEPRPPSEVDLRIGLQGVIWASLLYNDDPDPEFRTYAHLYAELVNWAPGSLDPVLRAVANNETIGVMVADPDLCRIYHPYDGGADVLLSDSAERDRVKRRHAGWLSAHPQGL